MDDLRLALPGPVNYILNALNDAGYEAFIVGGCVRDALLGREPNDWDITTSALPEQVKSIFKKTFDTGIKHGTVTVLAKGGQYEVTTYRIDGIYEDSRHPKQVTFTSNLTEDLRRRDFTINAMAYHPQVGIVDPFDGMGDLEAGVIRAVGNPSERFDEDALRIMRAVRFSAQLGFAIDPETALELKNFAPRLRDISHERIRDELVKLLISPYPETFEVLYDMGITAVIFPRFDEMMRCPQNNSGQIYDVGHHTLAMLPEVPADVTLRVAALLHDTGKIDTRVTDSKGIDSFAEHPAASAVFAKKWLTDMRFDNATIADVCRLVSLHSYNFAGTKVSARRLVSMAGELMPGLLKLMRADISAKSREAQDICVPLLDALDKYYEEILADGDCTDLKHLAIGGGDLISAGVKPGPKMGQILAALLDEVIEDPSKNNKSYLLGRAKEIQ